MTDFTRLQLILDAQLQGGKTATCVRRDNELHIQIAHGEILHLAETLHSDFRAKLILMVANDRCAEKGVFEAHYLFANHTENWFVHATEDLPADNPQLDSMATFYLPAGRLEREINDMFGIEVVGHPLSRRLVRHSFWAESYHPLRKDAEFPENFRGEGTPYPFLPVEGEGLYEIPVGPVHAGIIEPGHFRLAWSGRLSSICKCTCFSPTKGSRSFSRVEILPMAWSWPSASRAIPPSGTHWPTARRWRHWQVVMFRIGPGTCG
jgi:Ni,Fe-hydrogenase III component G